VKPPPPTREDRLRFVLVFVVLYGVLLFLIRPDPTPGQVAFRTGLMVLGAVGLGVLAWRKRRR
jgi:hypothetical protein